MDKFEGTYGYSFSQSQDRPGWIAASRKGQVSTYVPGEVFQDAVEFGTTLKKPWHNASEGSVYRILWEERMEYAVVEVDGSSLVFRFGDHFSIFIKDPAIKWAEFFCG